MVDKFSREIANDIMNRFRVVRATVQIFYGCYLVQCADGRKVPASPALIAFLLLCRLHFLLREEEEYMTGTCICALEAYYVTLREYSDIFLFPAAAPSPNIQQHPWTVPW